MPLKFLIFVFVITSVMNLTTCGNGHHHIIIHVPYKIHTIHHTITKHVHHHDQGDKYEVIGYTVGKPINIDHHFINSQEQIINHQDFRGNEFDNSNSWKPIYEQHKLPTNEYNHFTDQSEETSMHELIKPSDSDYHG